MRVLVAPDKYKGTLTAREAAGAIASGIRGEAQRTGTAVEIEERPVADGGEGTLEAIADATGAAPRTAAVPGPLGGTVDARWLLGTDAGGVPEAWIEGAEAVGLRLIPPERRDPGRASSAGLGLLIRAALEAGCRRIRVALGGSGTVDGGVGAASVFGLGLLDAQGAPLPPVGDSLARVRAIVPARPPEAEVVALCDVGAPLLGPRGAARLFGPQKGATPAQVERLEGGLAALARACADAGLRADASAPGAGAAGGLGFGLCAFLGARLEPGAPFILRLLRFDRACARADLVFTGEGAMDEQTGEGKACAAVAVAAADAGRPCIAVPGRVRGDAEHLRRALSERGVRFSIIEPASAPGAEGEPGPAEAALALRAAAARAFRRAAAPPARGG